MYLARKLAIATAVAAVASGGCDLADRQHDAPSPSAPTKRAISASLEHLGTTAHDDAQTALDAARAHARHLGITAADFAVRSQHGRGPHEWMRLSQIHQGLPVWGCDVVVHLRDGRAQSVRGNVTTSLAHVDTDELIARSDATRLALSTLSLPFARLRSAELVIYAGADRQVRSALAAWHVRIFDDGEFDTVAATRPPADWHVFLNAKSGAIIDRFDWLMTEQASGPGGNAKVSRDWVDALDVTWVSPSWLMETPDLQTLDSSFTPQVVSAPALDAFDDPAANDAHGFAEISLQTMQVWMGRDSIDDAGQRLASRVHYGVALENAFWNGNEAVFGDGGSDFYGFAGALDIVAHEFAHGFTESHAQLVYNGMPGGLNESFSDIAGTAAEWFMEPDTADLDIGEDIAITAPALRHMCSPSDDGASIDHADDFLPGIGIHFSSGIANRAFCLAARRLSSGTASGPATSVGVHKAARAWYDANANYWTQSTTFTQACQGVVDAARDAALTSAEVAALRTSWADVGVYCDGEIAPPPACDDTITANAGTLASPNHPADYPDDFRHTWCLQPGSDEPVTVFFTSFNTETDYDYLRIKDGDTAEVLLETSGDQLPAPITADSLALRFLTDGSQTAPGWSLIFTTPSENLAPEADFTSSSEGSSLSTHFTELSSDSDGLVVTWRWSFGDGLGTDERNPTHEYSEAGVYEVTLEVIDYLGATASITRDVTVGNTGDSGGCTATPTVPATELALLCAVIFAVLGRRRHAA